MANIDTIITELETIANASTAIESFMYKRVSEVNATLNTPFPLLLVDSVPKITRGEVNNSFLPRKKRYNVDVYLYNTYNYDSRNTTDLSAKQAELETILDQYTAEVIRRCVNVTTSIMLVDRAAISGFVANDVHNQKLVQVSYRFTFEVDSSCTLGTFNY